MLESSDSDGYMVGVLAVPSWMTPSDFLAFVAPAQEGMAHLRMIRCVSRIVFINLI
jgi:BRCA1-associated protein